ncbi:MAG: hypothetical protein NTX98_01800 [Candidatus Doudnabacteria bacterium]|nr:hypothetical protein [Candidatus Doudnabacteria bacterium]
MALALALMSVPAHSAELEPENEVSLRFTAENEFVAPLAYRIMDTIVPFLRQHPVKGEWIVILCPDEADKRTVIVDVHVWKADGSLIGFQEYLRLKGKPKKAAEEAAKRLKEAIERKLEAPRCSSGRSSFFCG